MRMHAIAILLAAATLSTPALARENRCGWIQNPTPGNYWLDDRDGTWLLMTQGGDTEPLGMENMPDLSAGDFVRTNGYYGYACGCMQVETEINSDSQDTSAGRITAIYSVKQLPIVKCTADKTLPKPE